MVNSEAGCGAVGEFGANQVLSRRLFLDRLGVGLADPVQPTVGRYWIPKK